MADGKDKTVGVSLEVAVLEPVRLEMSAVEVHPENPRIHGAKQIHELKASLLEHGYSAGSMVIQRSRMRLVKGHGIYRALLELGCVLADFIVKDMSDEEALVFLMRDNRTSDLSTWHPVKFHTNVQALQKMDVKMSRIGFSMKQIVSMKPKDVDIDPDELDADNIGSGKTMLLHVCPKCGFKFHKEESE